MLEYIEKILKRDEKQPIEVVSDPVEQRKIELTVKAIEGYVMFSCIAMGLLQMISLSFSKEIQAKPFRFLRTPSKAIVSEATVMCYLRQNIFRIMAKKPHLNITRFIQGKQAALYFLSHYSFSLNLCYVFRISPVPKSRLYQLM